MSEKKPPQRRWLLYILIPLVILVVLYALDLDDLFSAFRRVHWGPFGIGATAIAAGLILISVRWRFLLSNQVSFLKVFHSDGISYMIRMFTPVYAPVLRVATIAMSTPLTVSQATPPMMVERILEILMRFVALVLATILVSASNIAPEWVILWVLLLGGLFAGLVFFSNRAEDYLPRLTVWLARLPRLDEERLQGPMANLGEGLASVGTTWRLIFGLLLSLAVWGCFLVGHALVLDSLDFLILNWTEKFAISAAVLVVLPPSTPAMIFVYQGLIVAILLPFRFTNSSNLVAYGILLFSVQVVFWTLSGLWGWKRTNMPIRELIKLPGFKRDGDEEGAPEPEE